MWFTFGHLVTLLKLENRRYQTVLPKMWQKEFWTRPKMAKKERFDTKAAAFAAAIKLWPMADFTATERSTTPHDGIVDALLIAEWARRKF